ncbi:hypothetical protein ZIOFF_023959 [Zingiber officinale]|uniref:Uncharacterized protein n=1 Tax=Zingiber officinale TaxID=94328 RepID=A0A8J5GVI9_ZINOF|nr:hypothetical protein ZIOFF_023959 [Zingiber officinale]
MESERRVDPDCVNASNPFHVCADYCAQRARGLMSGNTGTKLAHKGGKRSEGIVFANRIVDPSCPNASNPFHECADYCSRRNSMVNRNYEVKRSGLLSFQIRKWMQNSMRNSAQNRGSLKKLQATVFAGRNVDPSCPNASNPFHECAEYCNNKKADVRTENKKKPEFLFEETLSHETITIWFMTSVKSISKLEDNRMVDRKCVNASNPYHVCTEYCIKKSKEIRHEKESKSVVVQNMEKHKEYLETAIAERNTDPLCPNASNPYHQCAEYCPSRQNGEKISGPIHLAGFCGYCSCVKILAHCSLIFSLSLLVVKNSEIYEEEGEIIVVVDDVDPSSQYTSNPYIPSILSTKDIEIIGQNGMISKMRHRDACLHLVPEKIKKTKVTLWLESSNIYFRTKHKQQQICRRKSLELSQVAASNSNTKEAKSNN